MTQQVYGYHPVIKAEAGKHVAPGIEGLAYAVYEYQRLPVALFDVVYPSALCPGAFRLRLLIFFFLYLYGLGSTGCLGSIVKHGGYAAGFLSGCLTAGQGPGGLVLFLVKLVVQLVVKLVVQLVVKILGALSAEQASPAGLSALLLFLRVQLRLDLAVYIVIIVVIAVIIRPFANKGSLFFLLILLVRLLSGLPWGLLVFGLGYGQLDLRKFAYVFGVYEFFNFQRNSHLYPPFRVRVAVCAYIPL